MCNRYERPSLEEIVEDFEAETPRGFHALPETVHPGAPGFVVLERDGRGVAEQMTWGFPVRPQGEYQSQARQQRALRQVDDLLAVLGGSAATTPCRRFAEAVGETGLSSP